MTTENESTANEIFLEVFKDVSDAPDIGQVEKWKQIHGDVFVAGFSESEIYIFRALTRKEYTALQIKQQMSQIKFEKSNQVIQQTGDELSPEKLVLIEKALMDQQNANQSNDEELVVSCLLWPKKTTEELQKKAGTVSALVEQIMQNSNFLTPAQAASIVRKL